MKKLGIISLLLLFASSVFAALGSGGFTGSDFTVISPLIIKGNGTDAEIQLWNPNNTFWTKLKSGSVSNMTITLPRSPGSNGDVLATDGSSNLSFSEGGRTSCPEGFSLVGTRGTREAFCISSAPEEAMPWHEAGYNCTQKKIFSHLCNYTEWFVACTNQAEIKDMPGTGEWISDFYFGTDNSPMVGGGTSCDDQSTNKRGEKLSSRCCFR